VTRNAAIEVLQSVTCAPITRTIRGIRSEVRLSRREGLPENSVISCDNLVTIRKARLDDERVGRLGPRKRLELDQALRYALDIRY
jgi:mRNA interferase MazF